MEKESGFAGGGVTRDESVRISVAGLPDEVRVRPTPLAGPLAITSVTVLRSTAAPNRVSSKYLWQGAGRGRTSFGEVVEPTADRDALARLNKVQHAAVRGEAVEAPDLLYCRRRLSTGRGGRHTRGAEPRALVQAGDALAPHELVRLAVEPAAEISAHNSRQKVGI